MAHQLQAPRAPDPLPPWRTPLYNEQGQELDPFSLFLANVPPATPEGDLRLMLIEAGIQSQVLKRVKMLHKGLNQFSGAIISFSSQGECEHAILKLHDYWPPTWPKHLMARCLCFQSVYSRINPIVLIET